MILVRPADVGPAAYRRLVRDRIVHPLADHSARPADVADSRGLRALAISPAVPPHTVLSGTAALWVHGWLARPPLGWTVVGRRGLHRTSDARLAFHSGATAALGSRVGPLWLAPPARACLDALRWEPPDVALPVVIDGIRAGRIAAADLQASLARDASRGVGFARLSSLVRAVAGATA